MALVGLEGAGGDERRLGRAAESREPAVEDCEAEFLDEVAPPLGEGVGPHVRRPHPGDLQAERGARLDDQLGVRLARHDLTEIGVGTGRPVVLPVAEAGADLGLHGGGIEVAHRDDRRALGAVIVMIEVGDQVGRRLLEDVNLADGLAVRHPLARQQIFEARLVDPVGRAVAGALLREHHSAFAVHGGLRDGQFGGRLAQQLQRGVDRLRVGLRQVELVDGLVEAGLGVGVGAEGEAQAFEDLDHLALGHGLRAVEGHVL